MTMTEITENREYRQYVYQLGKAFWKTIEKEWTEWLQNADANVCINEHTILLILLTNGQTSVSEVARLGTMHISTALNFSKKLREKGYLSLEKKQADRRTTYLDITPLGKEKLTKIEQSWNEANSQILQEAANIAMIRGAKPNFNEVLEMIKEEYDSDMSQKD